MRDVRAKPKPKMKPKTKTKTKTKPKRSRRRSRRRSRTEKHRSPDDAVRRRGGEAGMPDLEPPKEER
ncbi:hypothetical protein DF068_37325 [Burkholderia pseudomallei]|nr:hypothetical protein DF068_37325 [Burkholderia pseudomallei]